MKKLISLCLTLFLLVQLPVGVTAASKLETRVAELEEKYSINITYDLDSKNGPIIGTSNLKVLDAALSKVTATVVKQVSAYYQKQVGQKLTFHFTTEVAEVGNPDLMVLGHFDQENALIAIFTPSGKTALTTGCSPITIVHEFAHAYHGMAASMHGEKKMRQEWMALNGSVSNNEGYMVFPYNKLVFISSYAASSYEEDFADTFAHAFVRHQDGLGFQHRMTDGSNKTAIWKKVNYIENLLPKYLSGTDTANSNLRRAYTASVTMTYQGIRLSGEELQFMGLSQPRYVLGKVLRANGLAEAEDSLWISEVGAWQVTTTDSKYYLAFPGGICYQLTRSQLQKAA